MTSTESFQSHVLWCENWRHERIEAFTPENQLLDSKDQLTFFHAQKVYLKLIKELKKENNHRNPFEEHPFENAQKIALNILEKKKSGLLEVKNKIQFYAIKHFKWNHGFVPCLGGIALLGLGIGPIAIAFAVDEGVKSVFAAILGCAFISIGLVGILWGTMTFSILGCRTKLPSEEYLFSHDYESVKLCNQIKKVNLHISLIKSNEFREFYLRV